MKANRRKALGLVLCLLLCLSYFSPMQVTLRTWPETIVLSEGQTDALSLPAPLMLTAAERPAQSSQDERLDTPQTQLTLSLLGLPLRQTTVQLSPETRLVPGGMAIGVAMRTEGVLLVGTGNIAGSGSPAAACGLRPGDVLTRVDGVEIISAAQLTQLIADGGVRALPVEYMREGKRLTTTMTPALDESTGTVRMGAWVRDSTAGIGTLTFYDPQTHRYAALGHAITDGDTGQVLSVANGQILRAEVIAVQKGQKGLPGELKGSFLREQTVLGSITGNTTLGVYGSLTDPPVQTLYPEGLPIGLRSGVHTGSAQILSTVGSDGMQAYDVEITRVYQQSEPAPKSMVVRVTDPRLLSATGGIVQGMSGSPIVQDGRLIGAVTHV